jgi:hypothetical protein
MENQTPAVRQLPKYEDLIKGDINEKMIQNDLNAYLNRPPAPEWVKQHPMFKKVKYIPIERIESLLTVLFIRWHVEIRQVQTIANSVVVTVRLYYLDITSKDGVELWQDGLGAAPIQTDSGAGAMEWDKTKNDAVMKAAPAAESYAVKDAAEKIGKLFGKDLNRADQIMYDTLTPLPKRDKLEDLDNETNND